MKVLQEGNGKITLKSKLRGLTNTREADAASFLRLDSIVGGSFLLAHFPVRVFGAGNERGRGGKSRLLEMGATGY